MDSVKNKSFLDQLTAEQMSKLFRSFSFAYEVMRISLLFFVTHFVVITLFTINFVGLEFIYPLTTLCIFAKAFFYGKKQKTLFLNIEKRYDMESALMGSIMGFILILLPSIVLPIMSMFFVPPYW